MDDVIERGRARLLHDTDPDVVAKDAAARKAFAERIGTPKRCKVGKVHPITAECLYCGAIMGQACLLGFGG